MIISSVHFDQMSTCLVANSCKAQERNECPARISLDFFTDQAYHKIIDEINKHYDNQHDIVDTRRGPAHKTTTPIAKNHGLVTLEDLLVKVMSESATRTIDNPGRNVRQKSGHIGYGMGRVPPPS